MNNYMLLIKESLTQVEDLKELNGAELVMEFLWQQYRVQHPWSDRLIREAEDAMTQYLDPLSRESSDALFDLVSDLCSAYEKAAFSQGAQISALIATELNDA